MFKDDDSPMKIAIVVDIANGLMCRRLRRVCLQADERAQSHAGDLHKSCIARDKEGGLLSTMWALHPLSNRR